MKYRDLWGAFLLFGGNSNNGLKCGPVYCNLNNGLSNANWNYGAAQSIQFGTITKCPTFSLALAKNELVPSVC